jgi:hypothetical protein
MTTSRAWLLPLLALGAVTIGVALPAIAGAQEYPPQTASSTTVAEQGSTVPTTAPVTDSTVTPQAASQLPFTGGDIVGLTALGLGAAGGGYALMRSGRRRAGTS